MAAAIPSRSWSGRSSVGGMRDGTGASAIFSQPLALTTDPERSTMTTAAPTFSISSVVALAAWETRAGLGVWRALASTFRRDDFFPTSAVPSPSRCGTVPARDGSSDQYREVAWSRKDRAPRKGFDAAGTEAAPQGRRLGSMLAVGLRECVLSATDQLTLEAKLSLYRVKSSLTMVEEAFATGSSPIFAVNAVRVGH